MSNLDYTNSPIYRNTLAAADAWCFYFDNACVFTGLLFYRGWHSLMGFPIKKLFLAYSSLCLAIRQIELRCPTLYWRWRCSLLRLTRISKFLLMCGGLPRMLQPLRQGLLTHDIYKIFTSHKLPASSIVASTRVLLLSGGGILSLTVLDRVLPFHDQAVFQLMYFLVSALWFRDAAADVMQLPAFAPGTLALCRKINSAAHFHPLLLFASEDTIRTLIPDGCEENAARRVVLFSQLLLVFLLPAYYAFCYDSWLKQKCLRALQAVEVDVQRFGWFRQLLLHAVVAFYLMAVTWRCIINYEDSFIGLLEGLRLWVEEAAVTVSKNF